MDKVQKANRTLVVNWREYVIGANPSLHVIDGYVKRIWKDLDVEKVDMVRKGIFIVRLNDKLARDKACEMSGTLFDKKPFIIKP